MMPNQYSHEEPVGGTSNLSNANYWPPQARYHSSDSRLQAQEHRLSTGSMGGVSTHSTCSVDSSWDDIAKDLRQYEKKQYLTLSCSSPKKTITKSNSSSKLLSPKSPKKQFKRMPAVLSGSNIQPLLREKQAEGTLEEFLEKKSQPLEVQEAITKKKPLRRSLSDDSLSSSTAEIKKVDPLLVGKPYDCLMYLLKDVSTPSDCFDWDSYFEPFPSTMVDRFNTKIMKALHKDDPEALQKLQSKGMLSWNLQNSHGERLAHLACREGAVKVMQFLAKKKKVPLRVRDTSGKTLLHEICWFTHPPQFEIASMLLADSPELLFARDDRGWTALDYCPQKCRVEWCMYLKRKQSFIRVMLQLKSSNRKGAQIHEQQQRLLRIMHNKTGASR